MTEFFTPQKIKVFAVKQTEVFSTDINNMIDFDRLFDGLVEAI